ncbi:MAG: hypothetical protein U0234_14335 [Sandaracinus sp.]
MPSPPTGRRFVGRGRARERVRRWIEASEGQRLAIVGPAGIGKTRLVREALRGVVGCEVAWAGASPRETTGWLSSALGTEAHLDAIVRALRERIDLLVLDGVDGGDEELGRTLTVLCERLPHLRLVTTTRRATLSSGEDVLVVPGLTLPIEGAPLDASEAGALFLSEWAIASEGRPLSVEDEADVRRILGRIGALPLAIELLVPQVLELGARTFAERLERPLDWVVRGLDNPLLRALDGAARALGPVERRVLEDACRLERPFDADEATALAGSDALRVLRSLRMSSWLESVEVEGRPAYDLLPPVRQFVREHLGGRGPLSRVVAELVLRSLLAGRRSPPDVLREALVHEEVDPELVRAAFARAYHAFGAAGRPELYARVAETHRARTVLARGEADVALARAALDVGAFDDALAALARAEAEGTPETRERARMVRARIHFRTGRYDALATLEPTAVPKSAEDAEVVAVAARIRGDHGLGLALLVRALPLLSTDGDRAIVHALRARYLVEGGEAAGAEADAEAALALAPSDRRVSASIATTRALAAHDAGDLEGALRHYDPAVATYASLGSSLAPYVRYARALAVLESGQRDAACAAFLEAMEDSPAAMAQLTPFVALGRWLVTGATPTTPEGASEVIAASHALVEAYVARLRGDATSIARAVGLNAAHARWSVISRRLEVLARSGPDVGPPRATSADALIVGPGARYFALRGAARVSLETRPVLARVLGAVAETSERAPDARASIDAIAAAAWPGERILARARRGRVHVAISTLRKLGLGAAITHAPDGYRLAVPVVRVVS